MNEANPFPGLRPFGYEESHLFFGREEPTDGLLRTLRTNRFIAVIGTSGSGKSSLVRAGMLPDLYGGMMTSAGSSWRVAVFRPGNTPIHALAEDNKIHRVEESLVKTVEKMAVLEQQGKDNQKLQRKLFATVGKLAGLQGLAVDIQKPKKEEPATDVAALETKTISETQATDKTLAGDVGMIRSEQDFVTCNQVVRLNPQGISNQFAPGKIYVFARIYAPKEESLTLKWYGRSGEEFAARKLKIRPTLETGFRIYTWKNVFESGSYEVRLLNGNQDEIGRRQFTVSEAEQTSRK